MGKIDVKELYRETRELYTRAGIAGRIGFGRKAAVLVVDLMNAFTKPRAQIGSDLTPVVMANQQLLREARAKGLPVIFTVMGYRQDLGDAGVWPLKFFSLKDLRAGTDLVEVDERLESQPADFTIRKDYPSAFFGTSLTSILTANGVDTLIVTGTTTSGCVRATAVDGLSYGYRIIVPEECVGDRAELPHVANLFDIDTKYGDVMPLNEVLGAIANM